ncbi:MAG: hypothetical protein JW923_12265 [Spirochaetales bacterium]|nr:hypothetical protein [Spirochaetales bacterium]
MNTRLARGDTIGLLRTSVDAHTLGIAAIEESLSACGIRAERGDDELAHALCEAPVERLSAILTPWVRAKGITAIGFSYRLDPEDGVLYFGRLWEALERAGLFSWKGGPVKGLYFAGLPPSCALVQERFPRVAGLFHGDESPAESLAILGVEHASMPLSLAQGSAYDEDRMAFGRELVAAGGWKSVRPHERSYPGFGQRGDGLVARVDYHRARGLGPLMRAHVGPYLPDRKEAVDLFLDWTRTLATAGLLDILSVGSSQLTQEAFGHDWADRPNGGGVPINSEDEFHAVWKAARPMLVRAYSGTSDAAGMAGILERTIDIAWHALSFWWFSRLDGRGPHPVDRNLREHFAALRVIAASGKPFEPNVPHHFAFRGADDLSYVVSGYAAARAAKATGIKTLVLQTMLNTPKHTFGVQDLAKARALLALTRGLEDGGFRVILQPRGGLDYFSPDEDKAKAQLAAVTALMDDIEPGRNDSPDVIHVVSYTEGKRLADPDAVNDSVRLTRHALAEWRKQRAQGRAAGWLGDAAERSSALEAQARSYIHAMEEDIPDPYTPDGMHRMLKDGWFALPWLAAERDQYAAAASWLTRPVDGGVAVVDAEGKAVPLDERIRIIRERRARG